MNIQILPSAIVVVGAAFGPWAYRPGPGRAYYPYKHFREATIFNRRLLPLSLTFTLIALGVFSKLSAQENTGKDNYAHLFISYPLTKSGKVVNVFLNRKNIGKLSNGERLECRLLTEGTLAITMIKGSKYIEPLTQANNSRTRR